MRGEVYGRKKGLFLSETTNRWAGGTIEIGWIYTKQMTTVRPIVFVSLFQVTFLIAVYILSIRCRFVQPTISHVPRINMYLEEISKLSL